MPEYASSKQGNITNITTTESPEPGSNFDFANQTMSSRCIVLFYGGQL
jgi:hypothetical protein